MRGLQTNLCQRESVAPSSLTLDQKGGAHRPKGLHLGPGLWCYLQDRVTDKGVWWWEHRAPLSCSPVSSNGKPLQGFPDPGFTLIAVAVLGTGHTGDCLGGKFKGSGSSMLRNNNKKTTPLLFLYYLLFHSLETLITSELAPPASCALQFLRRWCKYVWKKRGGVEGAGCKVKQRTERSLDCTTPGSSRAVTLLS